MNLARSFFIYSCFVSLAGCAIHPVPENYEGHRTLAIVERIRCEAASSIQRIAVGLLYAEGNQALADKLKKGGPKAFRALKLTSFSNEKERNFYQRYIDSGISYAFTLDYKEENNSEFQADILKMMTNGMISANFKASNNRFRDNSRAFIVTESFEKLIYDEKLCLKIGKEYTSEADNSGVTNFIYPITGEIGLFEMINTFVEINEEGILSADKDHKAPVLVDTLMFSTILSGTVNPKLMLTPVGRDIGLSMASIDGTVTRTDLNKVIVSLSLLPKTNSAETKTMAGVRAPFASYKTTGAAVFARRTNLNAAEQRSLDAITQQRIDNFYDRFDRLAR